MASGPNKFQKKLELQPKYVANQIKTFSHPIFIFDLNDEVNSKDIVEICKKYKTKEYQEKTTESVYAWRSDYYRAYKGIMPEFSTLFDVVSNRIKKIYNQPYSLQVYNFWFAIYNQGDSSNLHDHGLVEYACVYYASCPDNTAPLLIPSESGDISIAPKEGSLVIMPGFCKHSVPKNTHLSGDRIIVAMNLIKDKFIDNYSNNIDFI